MAKKRKQVVIGFLGPKLDGGFDAARWEKWRPTVSLAQHDDFVFDRFELLFQSKHQKLADRVMDDIRQISPETEVVGSHVEFKDPWDLEEAFSAIDNFVARYPFDLDEEEYFVHITPGTHVIQIVEFLLVESRVIPARLVQTGPPSRRTSQAGEYVVIDLDLERYDRIARRFAEREKEDLSFLKSGVETRNLAFNELITKIEKVATKSRQPILLTGPTGAGKTQLARRIFQLKKRRNQVEGDFVEVNCATLRGEHAMSTLFGHVKGSFTGAQKDRPGLLRAANRGMLFLDEIGELGLDEQAMLLRAIETKAFLPLGSDRDVTSDFQLIAGTNRDLRAAVSKGNFREDLLARIDLWTFRLPGLRERLEDLEPNIDFELSLFERDEGTAVRFNKEARQKYMRFAKDPRSTWAANFRDLNSSIVRMSTLAPAGRIDVATVAEEVERLSTDWQMGGDDDVPGDQLLRDFLGDKVAELDRFDRTQLADVIRVCMKCSTMSEAGRELFSVSRAKKENPNDSDRIRKYLTRHGITWSQIREFAG